jgi:nucleotide-binding universal stress UspA family protein
MLLYAPTRDHAPESSPSPGPSRSILVGVDASDEARSAFAVAMERAGPNDTVVAVHAYPAVSGWLGSPLYQQALEERLQEGERIMGELMANVDAAQSKVTFEQHEGRPAEVLARIAALRDMDEIVVGGRRLGWLRALISSVSRALLRRTNRPVLVVPRRANAA